MAVKAFYKRYDQPGLDYHVIYNFASHRVDADLSFGEDCEGLRDDYIENIVKEAAEHAVKCINEHESLTRQLSTAKAALEKAEKVVEAARDTIAILATPLGENDSQSLSKLAAHEVRQRLIKTVFDYDNHLSENKNGNS